MPSTSDSSSPRRRTVRNTRDDHDPLGLLLEAMAESASGGNPSNVIVRQEQRGQQELVKSDVLPSDCWGREALEAAGVAFGELVPGDPLFRYATLPDGWKKSGTSHSMHSDLLDDQGRKRASIFYKAAFYDRAANMSASRRFSADNDYSDQGMAARKRGEAYGVVQDGEAEIYRTPAHRHADYAAVNDWNPSGEYAAQDAARQAAIAWLAERYPDWENPAAYWDLPAIEPQPATPAPGAPLDGEGV